MENQKQFSSENSFIVFTKNEIIEAIKENKLIKVIIRFNYRNRDFEDLLKKNKIPFTFKNDDFFKNLRKNTNFVGYVSPVKIYTFNEIKKENDNFYVLPLNIEDPQNLGAIIRSSEIFGAKGILLQKRRGVTITPTVIKTSTGAIFHIKIFEFNSIINTIKELKKKGFWIISLDLSGDKELQSFEPIKPFILIVGGEDKGINKKVLEESDFVVRIKTFGKTQSLNTSVALGIALYELTKTNK
jgi:23S rRNA (guanosine2251-2'-O)-methyltransferase